ncbi:transposable element Tcb1 transposase [Trichonephila clavipes]|nr:transposable element Tcb1 transposase [Trichonephila clavipes]
MLQHRSPPSYNAEGGPVFGSYCQKKESTASDLSRQLSSATGMTVSRRTMYRRLRQLGLYARRPFRCVPLTTTHCRLRLTWRREHALWTPQHWSCLMFSDEFRFSFHSDSRRTLICKAQVPVTTKENTVERHRRVVQDGSRLGRNFFPELTCMFRCNDVCWDVILEQHVRLFRGAMGAEFLFMDDNVRPYHAKIVDECLQSEDITRMDWPAYSPDLNQ